ncbi:MAG: S8 family serine peptidase [Gemmatimonadota bacterium]
MPPFVEIGPDDALVRGRTGRGISVAVIDSGIHAGHPHIGGVAGGVAIADDGRFHHDLVDRLGHGTAVAAAIHEKAPDAAIHVVKIFHDALATNMEALVAALDWASEQGIRLLNLSLGTANIENAPDLSAAVERVSCRGSILLSATTDADRTWYPGSLAGVVGALLDPGCPRERIRVSEAPLALRVAASGFARPIPGVPPERNLNGVSFSVANATGVIACLLEGRPEVTSPETLSDLIHHAA